MSFPFRVWLGLLKFIPFPGPVGFSVRQLLPLAKRLHAAADSRESTRKEKVEEGLRDLCPADTISGMAPQEYPTFGMAVALCLGLVLTVPSYSAEKVSDHRHALETQVGDATIYGSQFDGRKTASGIIFKNDKSMAAHLTYPFGTLVRVTYLRNKRSVDVVIVDRGPYGRNQREGAIIDLSLSAAKKLGMVKAGQARVKVEVLEWGNGK